MVLAFVKEPAGIVYHAFEAFTRDFISLELKIIIVFFPELFL